MPQITYAYTPTNLPQHQVVGQDASTIHLINVRGVQNQISSAYANTHFAVHQGIIVKPSVPVANESIHLSISGTTVSCEPAYLYHVIENQTIAVQIGVPESVELCGTSEWTEEVEIGVLVAGAYRVEAYVRLFEDDLPALLHTLDFTVEENVKGTAEMTSVMPQYQIFMPIIKRNERISLSQPCLNEALLAKIC